MREKKRRLETFSFYDRSGLEEHLAQMAERGWLLEKIGQFVWTYRRIEPQKFTFSVCYFPKASQFDPEPSEEQETFYDFCAHTGWTLAASSAQLQVFYNEREHPIPIETDPVTELDAIHRTMKRSFLPSQIMLLVVALLDVGLLVWQLTDDPIELLASPSSVLTGLSWVILVVLIGTELSGYFLWHARAVRAAERGEFLESKSHRKLQIGALVLLAVGVVYYMLSVALSGSRMMMAVAVLMFCVYVPGLFLVIRGVMGWLKRKKVPAKVNRAVTIVAAVVAAYLFVGAIIFGVLLGTDHGWFAEQDEEVYQYKGMTFTASRDQLPLTVEDLLDVEYEGYSREHRGSGSLFLAQYQGYQRPRFDAAHYREMPTLEYTVTVVKAPFLYDMCRDHLLLDRAERWNRDMPEDAWYSYEPVDPAPWGAEAAYCWTSREYGPRNTYLLCWPGRFVEIEFDHDWSPTPEQMAIAAEKLGCGEF